MVFVRGGTYVTSGQVLLDIIINGNSGNRITWQNYNNELVILDGQNQVGSVGIKLTNAAYNTVKGFLIENFENGIYSDGVFTRNSDGYVDNPGTTGNSDRYLILQNLEVKNNNIGIGIDNADNAKLSDLSVHNNGLGFLGSITDKYGEGVRITWSNNVLVERLTAYVNDDSNDGAYVSIDNGLMMYNCENCEVRDSTFYGNNMNLDLSGAITVRNVKSTDSKYAGLVSRRRLADGWTNHIVKVINSLFWNPVGAQANVKSHRGGQIEVYNSVLYGNARSDGGGIVFRPLGESEFGGVITPPVPGDNIIKNNIFAENVNNIYYQNFADEQPLGQVITDTNLLTGTAQDFVSAPNDFHLAESSTVIDSGLDLSSLFTDDFDGNARPQGSGWDIGAYEYIPIQCINGETMLCPLQQGVCQDSIEVCTNNVWPGCTSANYGSNYEIIESSCSDSLDNDCDGLVDLLDNDCVQVQCLADSDCDDGSLCTTNDVCTSGVCGGSAVNCDDNNVCNGAESCNPLLGCQGGDLLNCDDGLFCNGIEICNPAIGCESGITINCNDGFECTVDSCDENTDTCSQDTSGCKCNDNADNDNGGLIDLQDPGCRNNPTRDTEIGLCQDGTDNDNDVFIDYPADVGCENIEDDDEAFISATCNNNGMREGSEECDGSDLGVKACSNYGYDSGSLSCTQQCVIFTTGCYNSGGGTTGGESSGGGSSTTKTYSKVKADELKEYYPTVNVKVTRVAFKLKETINDVRLKVKKISLSSSIPRPDGEIYQYFEIDFNVERSKFAMSKIEFEVDKEWINRKGLTKNDIKLMKYSGGSWISLATNIFSERNTRVNYEVTDANGFSDFAIVGKVSTTGTTLLSNRCGNGIIDYNEDCGGCPSDVRCSSDEYCNVGVCTKRQAVPVNLCGNGAIDAGEDCRTCLSDVRCRSGEYCSAGVCVEEKKLTTTEVMINKLKELSESKKGLVISMSIILVLSYLVYSIVINRRWNRFKK